MSSLRLFQPRFFMFILFFSGSRPNFMYIARFFLHWWVYSTRDRKEEEYILSAIFWITQVIQKADPSALKQFAQEAVLPFNDFPRHVLIRVCHRLRDETVVGEEANALIALVCTLVGAGWAAISAVVLPEGTGLIPSVMISCLRQQCSSAGNYKDDFITMAIAVMA